MVEREAILSKKFRLDHLDWIWDLSRKNRDVCSRAYPVSHMNASKFWRRKGWRSRRDLGNRASPVDRAHMKGPFNRLLFHHFTRERRFKRSSYKFALRSVRRRKVEPFVLLRRPESGKIMFSQNLLAAKKKKNRCRGIYRKGAGGAQFPTPPPPNPAITPSSSYPLLKFGYVPHQSATPFFSVAPSP